MGLKIDKEKYDRLSAEEKNQVDMELKRRKRNRISLHIIIICAAFLFITTKRQDRILKFLYDINPALVSGYKTTDGESFSVRTATDKLPVNIRVSDRINLDGVHYTVLSIEDTVPKTNESIATLLAVDTVISDAEDFVSTHLTKNTVQALEYFEVAGQKKYVKEFTEVEYDIYKAYMKEPFAVQDIGYFLPMIKVRYKTNN